MNTIEKIEIWLKEMNIKDYIIDDNNLTVDVFGHVDISHKKLKKIPVQFNVIDGNFYCNNNELKTLSGSPKIVNYNFDCSSNQLKSLKYAPEFIGGDFLCCYNGIKNFKELNMNDEVYGNFEASNNLIKKIHNIPKKINKTCNLSNNLIKKIQFNNQEIENLDLSENFLTDLDIRLLNINSLNVSINQIKEIKSIPNKINYLDVSHNNLFDLNCLEKIEHVTVKELNLSFNNYNENIQKIKTTEELKQFLKSKHLYDELIQKLKSNNKNKKIDKI